MDKFQHGFLFKQVDDALHQLAFLFVLYALQILPFAVNHAFPFHKETHMDCVEQQAGIVAQPETQYHVEHELDGLIEHFGAVIDSCFVVIFASRQFIDGYDGRWEAKHIFLDTVQLPVNQYFAASGSAERHARIVFHSVISYSFHTYKSRKIPFYGK